MASPDKREKGMSPKKCVTEMASPGKRGKGVSPKKCVSEMASPDKRGIGVQPKKYVSHMASPRKIGKRVSPRKSISQLPPPGKRGIGMSAKKILSQLASPRKREKGVSFAWSDDLKLALLEICVAFQKKHGHSHPYKWPEIILEFEERTGKTATKEVLRNKLDSIKRDYGRWKKLRGSETGLGYDIRIGQIIADPLWWENKIKENKQYGKFRTFGFPPSVADLCSQLFDDTLATGEHFVAPGMGISARQPTPNLDSPIQFEDYVDEDIVDDDIGLYEDSRGDIERNFATLMHHGTPNSAPTSPAIHDDFSPQVARFMQVRGSLSKAKRQKRAPSKAALAADCLQGLISRGDQISKLIESVSQGRLPTGPATTYSMQDAMEILYRMVTNGLIDLDDSLFYFAASELRNEHTRQMFMIFKGDNERKKWLEFEFAKGCSKG